MLRACQCDIQVILPHSTKQGVNTYVLFLKAEELQDTDAQQVTVKLLTYVM